MKQGNNICLKPSCVLNIPIDTYEKDFTFIVNGIEFKTSRFIADLLSPVICKNHINDRTMDTFTINTHTPGDFSLILNLINFDTQTFQNKEIPFISEVVEILNNESIEIENKLKITTDNVFDLLKIHEENKNFYSKNISEEIDFISSHFYCLCENCINDMSTISMTSLIRIFTNDELSLKNEDQLLNFINNLYRIDSKFSILYETVCFEYVSSEKIHEFVSIYNHDQMSKEVWNRLSKRLEFNSNETRFQVNGNRYSRHSKSTTKKNNNNYNNRVIFNDLNEEGFNGILNYLRSNSKGHFESEVSITASSTYQWSQLPRSVTNYDHNQKNFFVSNNTPNSWIKFEFRNYNVKPTSYTIKSRENQQFSHPKSWVIEGSNNDKDWEILDCKNNCPILNGPGVVHTFQMDSQNSKEFKFIRMRLIGKTWNNTDILSIALFELHGTIN